MQISDMNFEDEKWLFNHTGIQADKANLEPYTDTGGLSSKMRRLKVSHDGHIDYYILKSVNNLQQSLNLGLAREALFYNQYKEIQMSILPKIKYSYGDIETGKKLILMDDLSATHIQSGYFFGNCSPHNWGKDLKSLIDIEEGPDRQVFTNRISSQAFKEIAKFHALYWNNKQMLNFDWLRGVEWYKNEGKQEWLKHQETGLTAWKDYSAKMYHSKVKWNPYLIECMNASFAKIDWDEYQSQIHDPNHPFTRIHGDFHPANVMWSRNHDTVVVVDWEVVGFGSGPQDCAQFLISHMYPSERKEVEMGLLQDYYDVLVESGVDKSSYSFDQCKYDYVSGGVGRWIWLLGILCGMCPDEWIQFFHDQLYSFIKDHSVTPQNIPMPRV
ncbi:kinase-like domain-containing protein [Globomyces pollinis-pini]|nr:kinase-like domain-containing protein [Globomyces pollinis-pini]